MITTCLVCGEQFSFYGGNCKYCARCRNEIYALKPLHGGYKKTAEYVIEKHREERELKKHKDKLKRRVVSIDYVVHEAMAHGRSYGHEVAVMEGREY